MLVACPPTWMIRAMPLLWLIASLVLLRSLAFPSVINSRIIRELTIASLMITNSMNYETLSLLSHGFSCFKIQSFYYLRFFSGAMAVSLVPSDPSSLALKSRSNIRRAVEGRSAHLVQNFIWINFSLGFFMATPVVHAETVFVHKTICGKKLLRTASP